MLTTKFSVNLNIPLLLWAAGHRHRPVPSALEWSVPAARRTLLEMMDGPARVPSCCGIALVGQGVAEHKPCPGSAWCCQRGHPAWDPVVAPVPQLWQLLLNFGSSPWCWACCGLTSLLIPRFMPDFFIKCRMPRTISQVLILVLALIPEEIKAPLREHPFHFCSILITYRALIYSPSYSLSLSPYV